MARFLVTEYAHSWIGPTLYVALTTDVPAHLWLRHTNVIEKMHIHEKLIRGLAVMGDPKYCFVEWSEVEQDQPGDTLDRTFTFNTWADGEQRWWHFRASIGGSPSESNTAIFTATYQVQGVAESLLHTDLLDKDPGDVIDHADGSVTPQKLSNPFTFATTPFTPAEPPTQDYHVVNKAYADDILAG